MKWGVAEKDGLDVRLPAAEATSRIFKLGQVGGGLVRVVGGSAGSQVHSLPSGSGFDTRVASLCRNWVKVPGGSREAKCAIPLCLA